MRSSGDIYQFILPTFVLESRNNILSSKEQSYSLRVQKIGINCNSTKLLIVDLSGILKIVNINSRSNYTEEDSILHSEFERKDVWDIKWADDNEDLFAVMEKARLVVFRNLKAEDPITTSGCLFN